ncbi:MAG: heme oxygenase (biliverdin-producing) [Nitriliruptoraceae bacterium]
MSEVPRGFADRLRRATTPDHQHAESSSFLERLVAGELDVAAYRLLTVQHLAIYRALESGAAALRDDPVVGALHDPALVRVPSLEADLAWLGQQGVGRPVGGGADRGERLEDEVLPATGRYTDRITEVARVWPAGFVAHHYTRYLGDLSGGLHLGRLLDRWLGGGTTFYRFERIRSPKRFKDAYRATLDAAPWDEHEQRRIIDEVSRAYAWNREVFAALAAHTDVRAVAADAPA